MKKMKKALFAVLAAFSLSACDFDIQKLPGQVADTVGGWIDSIKNLVTGGGEKEKEKEEEEEQPCEHQDANHDGVCDLCGEQGLVVTHTDANNDHLCDVCGAEVSQCKDDNHDHICDICGATVSTCKDEDNDFKCDDCGKDLAAVSFELDYSEATTQFAKGQEFSAEGLKVIVTSEVGSKQELSGESLTVEEPSMDEVGEKAVGVTFEFAGVSHSDSYKIYVSYWSADDLEVFDLASLSSYAPLPYLAGFNMRVEVSEDGESWWIAADNITSDAYLEYYNQLISFDTTAQLSSGKVARFKLDEVAVKGSEGFHGLSDVQVFRLVPYTVSGQSARRAFIYDEYFILGINNQGQMIIESRMINAMLDGYFLQNYVADGEWGWSAYADELAPELPGVIDNYYSELSANAFVYPKTLTASVGFVPVSLKSANPLAESLDDYDLAWRIIFENALESDYTSYLEELVAAGYEKETVEGYDYYTLENDYVGYMEFSADFYPEDKEAEEASALVIDFYYEAPKSYTNHLSVVVDDLSKALGIDFSYDNEDYEEYGKLYPSGYFVGDESITSGLDAMESLARILLEEGYTATGALKYNEADEEFDAYYYMGFCDGSTGISLFVDETAGSKGYFVEMYVSDSKSTSISKAEEEVKLFYPTDVPNPLRDFDYFENEDGSFYFYLPWGEDSLDAVESVSDLKLFAYDILIDFFFGDEVSYEIASNGATENNSWLAVFNDVKRGFELQSEAYVTETQVVTKITISEKVFITPETTIVDFLTAATGAAPEASDYTVNDDSSCVATIAIEGEHTAEEFADLASQFAAYLPEGFVAGEAGAASETSYVAYFSNESTNIEGSITISIGDEGTSAEIYFQYIPQMSEAESVIQAMTSALFEMETSLNNGYYYNSEYGIYYITLNFGEGGSEYNQWSTTQVSPEVPDGYQRTAYAYTTFAGDTEAVIQRWTNGTVVIDIIGYTSNNVNYCALQVYFAQ